MQKRSNNLHNYKQSLLYGALVGVSIGIAFALGFIVRGVIAPATAQAAENQYPLLGEVQTLINDHYLRDQPDIKQREYGAIRGMIATLNDKYTFFVDPPVAASESDVLAGTYGGVGLQLERSEAGKLVVYPYKDSPALQKGIEDGDELIAVNDTPVDLTFQPDVLDQMLRGEVKDNNGVKLSVIKPDGKKLTVFIPFAVINVPSVNWRVLVDAPQIGYVQITLFTSRTPQELKDALTDLLAHDVKALILDLRNNSGGLLKESVDVASQFLDGGIIVYEKTNNVESELNAVSGGLATQIPLVVLVNHGTASAAELVSGAIRDRGRGILIGQVTYGKGTVQQIFRLSDNSSLHITAAEWLTPKQQHLDGQGLDPDISMIPDVNGRDVELGEAVRQLDVILSKPK
ncbi:MAG: PDZ domain-containing protein [Anaerolineaceae bacterium]|nr:PDZ domain-containing protein [Anaerolineaceae bacterium]